MTPDAGETYDLVVVGAGMSGLAAAYYFVKNVGRGAKVLILDNHDEFGGHAKRKLGPNGAGVVEQGRPTELQAQGGAFARLFG